MEYHVYIIFKVENVLNLACWFSYDTSCPNSMFKIYFFFNCGCTAKEALLFFFLWSTLYKLFLVQSVLILYCWFYFVTIYSNSTRKTILFSKLLVFCKKSNDIDRAPWKMPWILADFDLSLLTRITYVKHANCECHQGSISIASFFKQLVHNLFKVTNIMNIVWLVFICHYFLI